MMAAMQNRVAEHRRRLGISQLELSTATKLSRQLVSALETGRHVPSVKAAMAIAQVLGTSVEELFGDTDRLNRFVPGVGAEPSSATAVVAVGVGDAVAYHPAADAGHYWSRADGLYRDGQVRLFADSDPAGIAVAGCDPALGLASALLPNQGVQRVVAMPASSRKAQSALDARRLHGAVIHGRPGMLAQGELAVRRFVLARWQVGLASLPGVRIDLERLARGTLTATRRDADAEVTRALDRKLHEFGGAANIKGPAVATHLDAARRVSYGAAQVAVTMEAAARAFQLDFVPLEEHVCELRIDIESVALPGVQGLIELIGSRSFQTRLQAVGGYDLSETGRAVPETV